MVDRVPLVFQQASVIRANCDANIEEMCGEMDVDAWSEKRWKLIFEENDVCVMTAQIFLDTLHHGFISLEKVIYGNKITLLISLNKINAGTSLGL